MYFNPFLIITFNHALFFFILDEAFETLLEAFNGVRCRQGREFPPTAPKQLTIIKGIPERNHGVATLAHSF